MQSKRANKHTSAPARSARWLRILESFSILFWFEGFSCLFFFPTYSTSSRNNRTQLYNNILFLILFSKNLPRPLPHEFRRIFLKPHISQLDTNWPSVHTKPVKDVQPHSFIRALFVWKRNIRISRGRGPVKLYLYTSHTFIIDEKYAGQRVQLFTALIY